MSIKLMGQVWECQFTKAEQSVMLAMADHAKDDGSDCYPSVDRIAWKTDYSERQVRRVIQDLTRRGILEIVRRSGRNRATEYRINLAKAAPKPEFKSQAPSKYNVKADTMSAQNGKKKADTVSAHPNKPDTVSAQDSAKGGHLATNGRTFEALKADIAMSPKPLTNNRLSVTDQQGSDSWMICLAELQQTQRGAYVAFFEGSRTEFSSDGASCRIVLARADAPIDVLRLQFADAIQRKLKSILRQPVLVEIVAAAITELEPTP